MPRLRPVCRNRTGRPGRDGRITQKGRGCALRIEPARGVTRRRFAPWQRSSDASSSGKLDDWPTPYAGHSTALRPTVKKHIYRGGRRGRGGEKACQVVVLCVPPRRAGLRVLRGGIRSAPPQRLTDRRWTPRRGPCRPRRAMADWVRFAKVARDGVPASLATPPGNATCCLPTSSDRLGLFRAASVPSFSSGTAGPP